MESRDCVACDEYPGIKIYMNKQHLDVKFYDLVGIEVQENFTLCQKCQTELKSAYSFKKRCLDIQKLYDQREQMIKKKRPEGASEDVESVFLQITEVKSSNSIDSGTDSDEDTLATLVQNKNKIKSEVNFEIIEAPAETENYSDKDNHDNDQYIDDNEEIETIEYDEEVLTEYVDLKQVAEKPSCVQYKMPVAADIRPTKRLRTVNHQEAKHKCDLCGKCFKKPYLLRTHKSYHQNNRNYKCTMCNSEFVESKGAIRHLRTVHQVSDEEIDKAKVLHQQVTAERIANNPPKETVVKKPVFNVYQCDTCKKSFTTAKYLYEHKTVKHGTAPFPCTYKGCKKGFISFNLLEKHVRQHTGDRPFKCSYCETDFCERKTMNQHLRHAHQVSEEEITQMNWDTGGNSEDKTCTHCKKVFRSFKQLRNHIILQHGTPPLVCDECGKGFLSQALLEDHQRHHSGLREFKCHLCPSQFFVQKGLNHHLRRTHDITEQEIYEFMQK